MPAPKGNKFYMLRERSGPDALFASPVELFNAAVEYFAYVDRNPWIRIDYKGGKRVRIPTVTPYTMKGLCTFLKVNESYFKQFKASLSKKTDIESKDTSPVNTPGFLEVIEYIEQIIYTQKYSGAAIGAFNANIISRDLGLVDRAALDIDFNKMNESDLDTIIERLNK